MKTKVLIPIILFILAASAAAVWFTAKGDENGQSVTKPGGGTSSMVEGGGNVDDLEDIDWEELMDTSTWQVYESKTQNYSIKAPSSVRKISEKSNSNGEHFTQFDFELDSQLAELSIYKIEGELDSRIYRSDISEGSVNNTTYADVYNGHVKSLNTATINLGKNKETVIIGGWEPSSGQYRYTFLFKGYDYSYIATLTLWNYAFCLNCDLRKSLDNILTLDEVAVANTEYYLLNNLLMEVLSMLSVLEV